MRTRTTQARGRRRTNAAPVSWEDAGERVIVTNEAGAWSIWKAFTWSPDRSATVGPGYIGRFRAANGALVVDDFYARDDPPQDWGTINDPQNGGLGCFGVHFARRNGQSDPNNYCWDVTGRHEAATRGGYGVSKSRVVQEPHLVGTGQNQRVEATFEVELTDGEAAQHGLPLMTVRYDYCFFRRRVTCRVAITTGRGAHVGSPAFVKEPKLVCHALSARGDGSPRYRDLQILSRDREPLQQVDIWSLPSPKKRTYQIAHDQRARCVFVDRERPELAFEVLAEALGEGDQREAWEGSRFGLDRWAALSNRREQLEPCADGADYCLQGPRQTLTRRWETTRWPARKRDSPPSEEKPQTGVMLHAWEGGFGYPDCRCCYRRVGRAGETFRVFLCYSTGALATDGTG
jgi:hypothetical protein